MKCPHCNYINGWDNETLSNIYGEWGEFFTFPIPMKRGERGYEDDADLVGCPQCNKVFIVKQ
jgi:hypothetical protein